MSDNPTGGPPRDENDPEQTGPADPSGPATPRPSTDPAGPGPEPGAGVPPAPGPAGAGPAMPPPGAEPPHGAPGGYPPPGPAGPPPQQPPAGASYQQPGGAPQPPPYGGPPPGGPQQPPYGPGGAYPPPGSPYGQPGGPGQPVQIGDAFNYGWTKFTQNVGPLLAGLAVYLVATFVLVGIFYALLVGGAMAADDNGGIGVVFGIGGLVLIGIAMLLSVFIQAAVIRVSLQISRGEQVAFASFFQFQDFGKVVVAALLVGVLTGVGYALCYLPGIVFAFFAMFTLFFVIDKGQDAVEALRSSFSLVNKNLGTVVILYIAVLVANAIGSALCGIGLLVSIPVCILATTFVYRRLNNEQPV
ncbi:hypothetical protein [Cellulosimicrobium arenosum]|uniref:Integral membrane protein n=1 Tax=Cellulosimicrobium arenosum TaxID=2708133 RepID=A0A927IY09_9MICO|nr:hypothetical protein [Cellulosimicrobium arenosum]MBD8077455.1 hypothetical protein [Cellulosimicrobium arenosum]